MQSSRYEAGSEPSRIERARSRLFCARIRGAISSDDYYQTEEQNMIYGDIPNKHSSSKAACILLAECTCWVPHIRDTAGHAFRHFSVPPQPVNLAPCTTYPKVRSVDCMVSFLLRATAEVHGVSSQRQWIARFNTSALAARVWTCG